MINSYQYQYKYHLFTLQDLDDLYKPNQQNILNKTKKNYMLFYQKQNKDQEQLLIVQNMLNNPNYFQLWSYIYMCTGARYKNPNIYNLIYKKSQHGTYIYCIQLTLNYYNLLQLKNNNIYLSESSIVYIIYNTYITLDKNEKFIKSKKSIDKIIKNLDIKSLCIPVHNRDRNNNIKLEFQYVTINKNINSIKKNIVPLIISKFGQNMQTIEEELDENYL